METLPNGHIVNAAQPVDEVVTAVGSVVLDFLTARTARRLGVHESARVTGQTASAASLGLRTEVKEHRGAGGRKGNPL